MGINHIVIVVGIFNKSCHGVKVASIEGAAGSAVQKASGSVNNDLAFWPLGTPTSAMYHAASTSDRAESKSSGKSSGRLKVLESSPTH